MLDDRHKSDLGYQDEIDVAEGGRKWQRWIRSSMALQEHTGRCSKDVPE